MKILKEYFEKGWKFEYEPAIGGYGLFNPDGKLVWIDHNLTATPDHVVKVIKLFS